MQSAMKRRLGSHDGLAAGVTHENGKQIILLEHQTMLDRDDEVVSESTVKYDRVKRVAPKQVRMTISLDGDENTTVVPVETKNDDTTAVVAEQSRTTIWCGRCNYTRGESLFMSEQLAGFKSADIVLTDGKSLVDVTVAIYPGWIRIQTESTNQFHPREQVDRIQSNQ